MTYNLRQRILFVDFISQLFRGNDGICRQIPYERKSFEGDSRAFSFHRYPEDFSSIVSYQRSVFSTLLHRAATEISSIVCQSLDDRKDSGLFKERRNKTENLDLLLHSKTCLGSLRNKRDKLSLSLSLSPLIRRFFRVSSNIEKKRGERNFSSRHAGCRILSNNSGETPINHRAEFSVI